MIKIGIECENLEDGQSRWGIGHMVLNLLKEYEKNSEWRKKFKLYLYFKSKIPEDKVLQNLIFIKRVVKIPGLNSFNIFYHILMPVRALFDNLDVMFFPAYMLPPLYFRKSVTMLTNDVFQEFKSGNLPFRYKLAYRLFSTWAAKKSSKILAISNHSRKEVARLYKISPDKIFVSKLGTDILKTDNYKPETDSYILFIGQMFPRRSAKESILAFCKISPNFPDLKFIIIGKDRYNPPQIDKLIREKNKELGGNKIIHYDYIKEDEKVASFYAGAEALIYVSSSEAFGLPPVEAAGHGIPIIVKDSELNRELFGDSAFFVKDQNDIDEFALVIKEAITNQEKRERFKKEYQEIIPKLNWSSFAKSFFENI